jgi:hypothetical protein
MEAGLADRFEATIAGLADSADVVADLRGLVTRGA